VGDDEMAEVVGVHAVVVDEPRAAIVTSEKIDEETRFVFCHRGYDAVELLEQVDVGVRRS
jgi:hypothetical protein